MTDGAGRSSVLLVEDSSLERVALERMLLKRKSYEVIACASVAEARPIIQARTPDVILLDIFMPKVTGFDFLKELRAAPATKTTPVILISGLSDTKHIVEGLDRGANDYVTKPIVGPIVIARIEALLRSGALVRSLEVQTELLSKLAAYDELTGLYNRRSLFHSLETEIARSQRYRGALSLMMIDLDRFKAINDDHGHAAGDLVLRETAGALRSALRSMDVVCRYGGEEFCAILPETGHDGGLRAAERVRFAVELHAMRVGDRELHVTASVGVSSYLPGASGSVPDLLAEADTALLEAKRGGRNRVVVFEPRPGLKKPGG